MEGGLSDALRKAAGLKGLKVVTEQYGGQLTVNLNEEDDPEVLEATVGQCNNGDRNFHQADADSKTAKLHQAGQAAVKISESGKDIFAKNINDRGCETTIDSGEQALPTPPRVYQ